MQFTGIMKYKSGWAALPLILVLLAFVMGLISAIIWLISPKTREDKEFAKQIGLEPQMYEASPQPSSQAKTPVCFDENVFWKWSTGDREGQAQVYFGPTNKSTVGTLLDEAGKNGVYTFDVEENSKVSIGVIGSKAVAYGSGSVGCDTITISIKGACSKSCDLDGDPEEYLKTIRIEPASLGLSGGITIKQ